MLNKRLRFFVRIIPDERNGRECLEIGGDKVLWITNEKYTGMGKVPRLRFEIDGVFTDACQAFIYEAVIGRDLYSTTTKMQDVVIMAIGQSGTGKTYTITGIRDHYHFRGLIPRIIRAIFELRRTKDFTLRMCALEFINGKCRNLLASSAPEIDCRKVTGVHLNAEYEANNLLFKAESNRCRISNRNCGSMVVTLFLKPAQQGVPNPVIQKIHLVDPAGTEVQWSRLGESPCVMKSPGWQKEIAVPDPSNQWAFLTERSIRGRLDARQAYRNSMMVGYLCNSLKKGSIRLIGHIRRASEDLRYTLAILRYGCGLCGRPERVDEKYADPETKINVTDKSLQREVQQLRDELAITDLLDSHFVPLSEVTDVSESLNLEVEKYLTSPEADGCSNLLTMAHPFTLLGICREVYSNCLDKLRDMYDLEAGLGDKASTATGMTSTGSLRLSRKSKKKSGVHAENYELLKVAEEPVAPAPSRLDQTKTSDTKEGQSEMFKSAFNNRKMLWKEFLSRYPHWHMKLSVIGDELRQARKERDIVEDYVKDLISKMQMNKFEVDKTSWERMNEVGNPVGPDGQLVLSPEEQSAQDERKTLLLAHKAAIEAFKQVHDFYKEVSKRFKKAHEEANQLFTEYVSTTYENILILPETEDYEEHIPMLGVDYSIKPTRKKSEENFIELQNKHLNKDKRGPPHPRWP